MRAELKLSAELSSGALSQSQTISRTELSRATIFLQKL